MRLAISLLAVLLALPHATKAAELISFSHQIIHYPAYDDMNERGDAFFEPQAVDALDPSNIYAAGKILADIFRELSGSFVARSDGMTDHWSSNPNYVLAGAKFYGDCDNFAFTAAVLLAKAGFAPANIYVLTVKSWMHEVLVSYLHPLHPGRVQATHMITAINIHGTWFAFDNLQDNFVALEEIMGECDKNGTGSISYNEFRKLYLA